MTDKNSSGTCWAQAVAVLAVLVLFAIPADAEGITVDDYVSWAAALTNPSSYTFDARSSDKLVVVVSGEHNFPGNYTGNITGITYDGQTLLKAVEQAPNSGLSIQTTSDIWYLDNPWQYYTAGTVTVSVNGNGSNYVYTAVGLSGTAPGVGATAAVSGAAAVDLTTTAADSMVIFNLGTGGSGNTAGGTNTILPNSPAGAVQIDGKVSSGNYAGQSVARATISSPSLQTFSFNTTKTDVVTIAAEFKLGVPHNLTLRVDPVTGDTTILGDPTRAFSINYYQITSAAHSLDAVNWISLADQDFEGSGPPSGMGNGWEEAGGAGPHALAEAFLLGNSAIGASASISLGKGFDPDVDAEDLVFTYRTDAGKIVEGLVEYVTSALPGDANLDGVVDAADYIALKRSFGTASGARYQDGDFDRDHDVDWRDLQTLTGALGAGGTGAPSIPEPASLGLLAAGAAGLGIRPRKNGSPGSSTTPGPRSGECE